jgi:hypothetical protein
MDVAVVGERPATLNWWVNDSSAVDKLSIAWFQISELLASLVVVCSPLTQSHSTESPTAIFEVVVLLVTSVNEKFWTLTWAVFAATADDGMASNTAERTATTTCRKRIRFPLWWCFPRIRPRAPTGSRDVKRFSDRRKRAGLAARSSSALLGST